MPIIKEYITLNIEDIIPYENNPRINDDAVAGVVESIKQCGELDPIEVDENNVILSGHTRLRAYEQLEYKQVSVLKITGLTEPQKRKYRLLTNKTGEVAAWDFDKLGLELEGLDFDGFDFGFDVDLPSLEEDDQKEVVEDDYDEEPPTESKAKLGDLWILGNNRLICGDSTDAAVIDRLMDGVKADIAFTSPPYGVGLDYNEYVDTFENTNELVHKVLPLVCKYVADYIVLNWGDIVSAKDINKTAQPSMFSWLPTYTKIMQENGWNIWAERIWKKVHARCSGIWSASSNRPVSDWEYIFTWANGAPRCNERKDGSHFGIIDSAETSQSDTLSQHPGAFPVYVAAKVIQIHTEDNSRVLDPFGGSGSTLIACEQLNRKCYMAELDPKYVSVIVNRWLNLTGRKDEIFCIRDGQKLTYDEVFN